MFNGCASLLFWNTLSCSSQKMLLFSSCAIPEIFMDIHVMRVKFSTMKNISVQSSVLTLTSDRYPCRNDFIFRIRIFQSQLPLFLSDISWPTLLISLSFSGFDWLSASIDSHL